MVFGAQGQPPMQMRWAASQAVVQFLSFIAQWLLHSAQRSAQSGVHAEVGYPGGTLRGYSCS